MSSLLTLAGNAAPTGFYDYSIDQSLRFEDGDSAYLSRTPASAGNRRTFTLSFWYKNCDNTNYQAIWGSRIDGNNQFILQKNNNALDFYSQTGGSVTVRMITNAVFRDVSTWYHIVLKVDVTTGTSANAIYVNGVEQSLSTDTSSNTDTYVNSVIPHQIGRWDSGGYINAYMADVNFIDGQALDATSFGEFKSGIWIPKDTSGLTFGTNGFRLEYANSAAIGDDTSGNTNDFTANNLAASDVVPDSPTNNFATLNLLHTVGTPTLSEGNLKLVGSGTDYDRSYATFGLTSGKWYAEFRYLSGDNRGMFGVVREDSTSTDATNVYIGSKANQYGLDFRARAYSNSTELFDTTDFSTGDIGLLCFDIDNGKLWFGRRDISGATTIWYDSAGANNGDPSAGTNPTYTGTFTGHTWFIGCHDYNGTNIHANFGADGSFSGGITSGGLSDANGNGDFNYIEDGFLALCSANLPTGAIDTLDDETPEDYFNTVLWTGDNTTGGRSVTGVGFQPDLVYAKSRSAAYSPLLYDSIRGTGATAELKSDGTEAEGGSSSSERGYLNSFDSDGFSSVVGTNGDNLYFNQLSETYVAWNWKAGGSGVSNTDGSITSTVSVGATSQQNWFSIVSYTGTGSNATVGHGLGVAPRLYIVKYRNAAGDWKVYSEDVGNTYQGFLNDTSAFQGSSPTLWNSTSPTSSVFSIGTNGGVNTSGGNYIAYCFANAEGLCKVGSYTGNGSTDGVYVACGFRPSLVLLKRTDGVENWLIYDNKRDPHNVTDEALLPNSSSASGGSANAMDLLSNGFKFRSSAGSLNASGGDYIYLAIAEQPFKYANAR